MLNKLVDCIAQEEENHPQPHYHSFYPEAFPAAMVNATSQAETAMLAHYPKDSGERFKALQGSKRYLLCHYFDLTVGASFGG